MKDFAFGMPTRIVFGQGASARMGALCREYGAAKVMVITDKIIGASEGFQLIKAGLDRDGIDYEIFDDVIPEPPAEHVDKAAEQIKTSGCGMVIAVGGGSAIDTAKAVCALCTNEGSIRDYLFGGSRTLVNRPLPLVAVPTTAGSGSEVTAACVISDEEKGIKLSLTHPWIVPVVAVVDPIMHKDMPTGVTSSTGMDALTHAVESYVSLRANPVSDAFALAAIEMIGKNIRRATCVPHDMEARSNMAVASVMAAAAFVNGGLGAVHGMSQAMGGVAHVSHGVGNALLLPYVCQRNLPGAMEHFANVARLLGQPVEGKSQREAAQMAVDAMFQLLEDLRLPSKLHEVKVTREMFPAIIQGTMDYRLLSDNPVKLTPKDVQEILDNAY